MTVLGLATVRAIATTAAFDLFSEKGRSVPDDFWPHSVTTAAAAAAIARRVGIQPNDAFSSGLLHDLGSALVFRRAPRRYDAVLELLAGDPDALAPRRRAHGVRHDPRRGRAAALGDALPGRDGGSDRRASHASCRGHVDARSRARRRRLGRDRDRPGEVRSRTRRSTRPSPRSRCPRARASRWLPRCAPTRTTWPASLTVDSLARAVGAGSRLPTRRRGGRDGDRPSTRARRSPCARARRRASCPGCRRAAFSDRRRRARPASRS